MKTAIDAIALSSELIRNWLGTCMFSQNDKDAIDNIVNSLNEHDNSKVHNRHFSAEDCKKFGLKIKMMEDDNKLQDAILSLHHATMFTFESTTAVKIIENQEGNSLISHFQMR